MQDAKVGIRHFSKRTQVTKRMLSDQTESDLTPKQRAFLAAYAECGTVKGASIASGYSRNGHYVTLKKSDKYAKAFEDAKADAADRLEGEAIRRARDGVQKLKFYQGKPIMVPAIRSDGCMITDESGKPELVPYVEHEYSDTLLIFLLKAADPKRFADQRSNLPSDFVPVHLYLPEEDKLEEAN